MRVVKPRTCFDYECVNEAAEPSAWCTGHRPHPARTFASPSTPATEEEYYRSGMIRRRVWKNERGELSRRDGPAVVKYLEDGKVYYASWHIDGMPPPGDVPTRVEFYLHQWSESYFVGDVCHRENGPAGIVFDYSGAATSASYHVHGKAHRLDGPAVIDYEVAELSGRFYVYGQEVSSTVIDTYQAAISDGAPHEWALAYAFGTSV